MKSRRLCATYVEVRARMSAQTYVDAWLAALVVMNVFSGRIRLENSLRIARDMPYRPALSVTPLVCDPSYQSSALELGGANALNRSLAPSIQRCNQKRGVPLGVCLLSMRILVILRSCIRLWRASPRLG